MGISWGRSLGLQDRLWKNETIYQIQNMEHAGDVCLPFNILGPRSEDNVFLIGVQSLFPTPSAYVPESPLVQVLGSSRDISWSGGGVHHCAPGYSIGTMKLGTATKTLVLFEEMVKFARETE